MHFLIISKFVRLYIGELGNQRAFNRRNILFCLSEKDHDPSSGFQTYEKST
jgi:hypothetical protein